MQSESAVTVFPGVAIPEPPVPASSATDAGVSTGLPNPANPIAGRGFRVAVVTETYPPEVNGVAMTVARVVEGLRQRGSSVQLIRPRQGPEDCAGNEGGLLEVLTGGADIPGYRGLRVGMPSGGKLRRLWEQDRPEMVHIATEGPLGWSALRAATALGIPVVSEFRTNFHAYSRHYGVGWLRRPIQRYLRHFHNRTACTMVPTGALAGDLAEAGFENLAVVARGVDTRLFDPVRRSEELRRSWGATPDTVVVLAVGRLAPEKNLGVLQAAFAAMRRVNPSAVLVLVGDGPSRSGMQTRCPDAVFAGMRRGEDLAAHYASADVLLFPSLTETYGNVTPEAMASGLAVVAFDYAAAAQLIRHGESGWLAPYEDADQFVRLAMQAARGTHRLRRIGENARRVAEGMSWSRILEQIEGHYRTAISRVRSPAVHAGTVRSAATPGYSDPWCGELPQGGVIANGDRAVAMDLS
ncbi:MAG: hypothetical protein RIS76_2987 [Verrucomicrobiota bacterium]